MSCCFDNTGILCMATISENSFCVFTFDDNGLRNNLDII